MKRSYRVAPGRLVSVIAGAVAAAFIALAVPAMADDKTVATIDGVPIKDSDIGIAAQDFADQLARIPPDRQKAALLDVIIDIRLLAKAAETAGLDKDPGVAQRLEFTRDRALRNEYLRSRVAATITDAAVKKRFDDAMAKFVPGDEIHVRHILVKTEDEAKEIIGELDKGGDFAAIAKEKSIDPGSATNGGDLGFIGRGKTVKPFEDAAFALDVGTYTKTPVQSDYGWHVIKVEEKRKEAPPKFEDQADQIRQDMIHDLFTNEVASLRAAAKIDIVPDAPPAPDASAPAAPAAPAPAAPAPAAPAQ